MHFILLILICVSLSFCSWFPRKALRIDKIADKVQKKDRFQKCCPIWPGVGPHGPWQWINELHTFGIPWVSTRVQLSSCPTWYLLLLDVLRKHNCYEFKTRMLQKRHTMILWWYCKCLQILAEWFCPLRRILRRQSDLWFVTMTWRRKRWRRMRDSWDSRFDNLMRYDGMTGSQSYIPLLIWYNWNTTEVEIQLSIIDFHEIPRW